MSSQDTVERRTLRNALTFGASFLVSAGLGFLSVPICLSSWGAETYGLWLALFAGFNMLRTLDNGYVSYVGNELNVLHHSDPQRLRCVLASALPVCLGLGMLELLLVMGLEVTSMLDPILGVSAGDTTRYHLALALCILIISWTLAGSFQGILSRLLIPVGLMHQGTWWSLTLQAIQILALVGSALAKVSIVNAILLYASLQAVIMLALARYVRIRVPGYYPWWHLPSAAQGLRDLARASLLTLSLVGQQATLSGLVLLFSNSYGHANVPMFVATRTLTNVWTTLSGAIVNPLNPEIIRYHGKREARKLTQALHAYWLFSTIFVNGSMIVLLPITDLFYTRWTHGLVLNHTLFYGMLGAVASASFGAVLNVYLHGINRLRAQLVLTAVRALLVFSLVFALRNTFGVGSFGIALCLAEFVTSVGLGLYFVDRELAGFGGRLPSSTVTLGLLGLAPLQALIWYGMFHRSPSALVFVATGLVTSIAVLMSWRSLDEGMQTRARAIARKLLAWRATR